MDKEIRERTAGEGAIDALMALLARIGEIFGVFDLSFFVAGTVCAGALVFGGYIFDATWFPLIDLQEWRAVHIVAAIVGSYVLGLVCFAAGRKLRPDQRFYLQLPEQLREFGLGADYGLDERIPPLPSLRARLLTWRATPAAERAQEAKTRSDLARKCSLVYTRLWAEVRQDKALAPSFNLVTRYWVMAAMCDGLAAALLVWTVLWTLWSARVQTKPLPPPSVVVILMAVALIGGIVLCFLEARRYTRYQMYEIVATLAYRRDAGAVLE